MWLYLRNPLFSGAGYHLNANYIDTSTKQNKTNGITAVLTKKKLLHISKLLSKFVPYINVKIKTFGQNLDLL